MKMIVCFPIDLNSVVNVKSYFLRTRASQMRVGGCILGKLISKIGYVFVFLIIVACFDACVIIYEHSLHTLDPRKRTIKLFRFNLLLKLVSQTVY